MTFLRLALVLLAIAPLSALAQEAPDAPKPPPAKKPAAGYDKGFTIRSDDGRFSLGIEGRVQPRFELEAVTPEGADKSRETVRFQVRRMRVTLHGTAFRPQLTYKFQMDFGAGFVTLKDAYPDYEFSKKLVLRAGQFKRPFDRQQITSSGKLQFVDRSLLDADFESGRDVGVMLHNHFEKSPELEYAVGVFNGQGDTPQFDARRGRFSTVPSVMRPVVVARVGYNANGIKGYSQADLEGGPLRWSVGASVLNEFDMDGDDVSKRQFEVDALVKAEGLSVYLMAGHQGVQDEPDWGSFETRGLGAQAQVGYMVTDVVEVAGLYALFDGEQSVAKFEIHQELLGALNFYFEDHGWKWQTDAGVLPVKVGPSLTDDFRVRSQLQLAF